MENRDLDEYIKRDNQGALLFTIPAGFTGQGCLWFATVAPEGWLICDGSLVDKEKYPRLWQLLGDAYGTSTATQFYLPDMRQRVPVGRLNGDSNFGNLNDKGGTKTHTLTTAEMPAHSHSTIPFMGWGAGAANGGRSRVDLNSPANNWPNTGSEGGGGSHNNLQPYITINFIIKT